MSSDSGESHSSAHNDHGDEIDVGPGAELDVVDEHSAGEATEGLTFARTRSIPQQDAHASTSELSTRPKIEVERAESLTSTDIPDDTPSIQARCLSRSIWRLLTMTGLGHLLAHEQRTSLT